MRLLVTRPQPQASQWVDALRARAIEADALPLIDIAPAEDIAPVRAAWDALPRCDLVVFVSPSAVASFFDAGLRGDWPAALMAATPGPGTAARLREAGVTRVTQPLPDAPAFDSEALWERLRASPWQGRRVLVVRGDGGRDWLAGRLREAGADVAFVQAYRRVLPRLEAAQRALLDAALAAPAGRLWHFSSSQAIDHLLQLAPGADWSRSQALASHPRIGERAGAAGFAAVTVVAPSIDAVVAQVATLQSRRP